MRAIINPGLLASLISIGSALFAVQPQTAPNPPADDPIIGFVEDGRAAEAGKPEPGLRVAFQRQGEGWRVVMSAPHSPAGINLCSIPGMESRRSWTVLNAGRRVGAVTTEGWLDAASYSHHGLLCVIGPAPLLGAPSALFGGWIGEPRHRPLMAYSGPFKPRPAPWRSSPVHKRDLKTVWPAIQQAIPLVPRCGADGEPVSPQPRTTARDVEVFKAFEDGQGSRLLGAHLREGDLGDCEGLADRSRSDFWFLVSAKGGVTALEMPDGDDAVTLTPIDFLDLGKGGSTVAVFYCSGYNHDGYRIYYDGFRKLADFSWNYH